MEITRDSQEEKYLNLINGLIEVLGDDLRDADLFMFLRIMSVMDSEVFAEHIPKWFRELTNRPDFWEGLK